jgi:polygalacturonase
MNIFNPDRRDLLRSGSLGLAAFAAPVASFAVTGQGTSETSAPPQHFFDVRTFGAAGDGKTLDTQAVNRAIDAAASAGGGMVIFPAGTYLCFSIHLKSEVNLYLTQGSAIVAADSPLPNEQTGYRSGVGCLRGLWP